MSRCRDCGQDKELHSVGTTAVRCRDCHLARQRRYDERRKESARRRASRHDSTIRRAEVARGGPSLRALRDTAAANGMQYCSRCQTAKDPEAFYARKHGAGWCRSCWNVYAAERRKQPEIRERLLARERELRGSADYSAIRRRAHLARTYDLTVEEFQGLWDDQHGACAVCRAAFDQTTRDVLTNGHRGIDIDHCHDRGVVRGLLCPPCNKALGLLKDDPAALHRAAEYVQQSTTM